MNKEIDWQARKSITTIQKKNSSCNNEKNLQHKKNIEITIGYSL